MRTLRPGEGRRVTVRAEAPNQTLVLPHTVSFRKGFSHPLSTSICGLTFRLQEEPTGISSGASLHSDCLTKLMAALHPALLWCCTFWGSTFSHLDSKLSPWPVSSLSSPLRNKGYLPAHL